MAIKVTAGSIMTRGMGGLTPTQFKELLDNSDKVDAIIQEIDARRDMCITAEAEAKARLGAAEVADASLVTREADLARAQADLAKQVAAAESKQQGGAETLTKLTREVSINAAEVDKRATVLDQREQRIAEQGRVQDDELRAREKSIENAEKAVEKREQELLQATKDVRADRQRLDTAVSLVKKAVAGLK